VRDVRLAKCNNGNRYKEKITVLQAAHTRFIDDNGTDSLEPMAKTTVDMCIANLVRAIELNAGATPLANWEAFIASMK
jgi:hypothetical protein